MTTASSSPRATSRPTPPDCSPWATSAAAPSSGSPTLPVRARAASRQSGATSIRNPSHRRRNMFHLDVSGLELATIRAALGFFRDQMAEPVVRNEPPWAYVDESLGALTTEELDTLLGRL